MAIIKKYSEDVIDVFLYLVWGDIYIYALAISVLVLCRLSKERSRIADRLCGSHVFIRLCCPVDMQFVQLFY